MLLLNKQYRLICIDITNATTPNLANETNKSKPGSKGGTLNPAKRKVTQKDIDQLNINKLNFKDGKLILGMFRIKFYILISLTLSLFLFFLVNRRQKLILKQ